MSISGAVEQGKGLVVNFPEETLREILANVSQNGKPGEGQDTGDFCFIHVFTPPRPH